MRAITISEKEKKEAFFEVSFNRYKALKLFSFTFAAFIVGLSALFWTLDYQYEQRLNALKQQLLSDFDKSIVDNKIEATTDLYEGVVLYRGKADFDNVRLVQTLEDNFQKELNINAVHGQKRAVAQGVYQIRFVKSDIPATPFEVMQ